MCKIKNRLAIFDIDGTLTDSVKIHQSAFLKALNNFGLFNFDTNWSSYWHHTDSYIFKTIFEVQFKKALTQKDIEHFENLLHELISVAVIQNSLIEIEGAKNFLFTLKHNSDFDIVFATGSLFNPAKLKLEQVGISLPDSLIVSANQVFSRDELVLKAIETAKVFHSKDTYEQIVSFGDGLWDYETAKNLNIDFIGIGNFKFQKYGVKHFFSDFTEATLFNLMRIKNQGNIIPDFQIKSSEKISKLFIENNILNFQQAVVFVKKLPYGRNADKENLETVFIDGCGTCSTKHALLKQLAIENNFDGIKLFIGLFKMNSKNTPEIASTIKKNNIEFIPEVHCFLKFENEIIDVTKANSSSEDFINDLIEEIKIQPNQITNFKVDYHKIYLQKWLKANSEIKFTLDEIWAIREQCIQDLATYQ